MRLKNLYKKNSVVISDQSVVKTVRMPLACLSRRCNQHEAHALRRLEELGFSYAPRLLHQHGNVLAMTRFDGAGLGTPHKGNKELFLSIVSCIKELHSMGFAHCNITRRNIMVSGSGEICLIDYETHCRKGNMNFGVMKLWDYIRLYKLSLQIFYVTDQVIRDTFPRGAMRVIYVARPIYKLSFIAKWMKRRVLGEPGH